MTAISIAGVAVGVWALTVVLSVMSGFEADLKKKILGTNAHALLLKYSSDFSEWKQVLPKVLAVPGIAGASPFILNEVILSQGQTPTGAELKAIDRGYLNGNGNACDAGYFRSPELRVMFADEFVAQRAVADRDLGPCVNHRVERDIAGADVGEDQLTTNSFSDYDDIARHRPNRIPCVLDAHLMRLEIHHQPLLV